MQVQAMGCWGLLQTPEARRGKVDDSLKLSVRVWVCWYLDFRHLALRTVREEMCIFSSHPFCGTLLRQPGQTNMVNISLFYISLIHVKSSTLHWQALLIMVKCVHATHTHEPLLFNTSKLNNGFQNKPASCSIPLHLKGLFVGFALFYMLFCFLFLPQNSSYNAH